MTRKALDTEERCRALHPHDGRCWGARGHDGLHENKTQAWSGGGSACPPERDQCAAALHDAETDIVKAQCVLARDHVGPHESIGGYSWDRSTAWAFCGDRSPLGDGICIEPPRHSGSHGDGRSWWGPNVVDEAAREAAADEVAFELTTVLARLGQTLEPVLEATTGYRARCMAEGYPEDVAARMAADYHHYLTRMLTESLVSQHQGPPGGR